MDACGSSAAQITWEPSSNNNDPIIDFTVYYNTSFDDPDIYHIGKDQIPAQVTSARIPLSPWANYTFHVKARNSLGYSDRLVLLSGEGGVGVLFILYVAFNPFVVEMSLM